MMSLILPNAIDPSPMPHAPKLYLGSCEDAADEARLLQHDIGYILNVTKEIPFFFQGIQNFFLCNLFLDASVSTGDDVATTDVPATCVTTPENAPLEAAPPVSYATTCGVTHLRIAVADTFDENLGSRFAEACDFLDFAMAQHKGNILVHCQMGASRSASIILCYLLKKWRHMSLQQCLHFVQQQRAVVMPNPSFMAQLMEWEAFYHPSSSSDNSHVNYVDYCVQYVKQLVPSLVEQKLVDALFKANYNFERAMDIVDE